MISRLFSLSAVYRGKSELAAKSAERAEDTLSALVHLKQAETWMEASRVALDFTAELIEERERELLSEKWED